VALRHVFAEALKFLFSSASYPTTVREQRARAKLRAGPKSKEKIMFQNAFNPSNRHFAARMTSVWTSIGAIPTEVLLHKGFGRRYLGVSGFLALFQMGLAILLFAYFHESTLDPLYDAKPLLAYFGLYVVAYFFTIYATIKRHWRGQIEHTRYNGWPRFLPQRLGRFERSFKIVIEPNAVFLVGLDLAHWNWPLGLYLMFNAFCMFWSNIISIRFERRRAMDLQDAVLEQQASAQALRSLVHRF
jgi:hypothetical protein